MSSVREQILAAIATALTGTTGASVFREHDAPLSRDDVPGIVVSPDTESDQLQGDVINESTLAVDIAIYTRGDPVDQLADPVAVAAHRILMTDATLASLAHNIDKRGSKWERHEADQTAGVLTMSYHFRYLHPVGDLTQHL